MVGTVRALFVKPAKGVKSVAKDLVQATPYGFDGDYHTGVSKRRQILLISGGLLEELHLEAGNIDENVIVDGFDVMSLREGQKLRLGAAVVVATIPCEPCVQMDRVRTGLQHALADRRGMFVTVLEPGTVRVGDRVVLSVKTALTIAGSDPSGGAGIQADLKTFSRLRTYGMSVITALTAQNTSGVAGAMEIPSEFVARQFDAVLTDIRVDAAKTGMLLAAAIVEVVAQKVMEYQITNLVVDPVMVSTSGAPLLDPNAIGTFCRMLLPLALVITPNIDEAQLLTGRAIKTVEDMEEAALQVHGMGARCVLIKGGHLEGDEVTDVLFDGKDFLRYQSGRIYSSHTHGTGCVLSAAITAELAAGKQITEAVQAAREFVLTAIRNGLSIGKGTGPCDPLALEN